MKRKLISWLSITGYFVLLCSCSTADREIKLGDKQLENSNLYEVINPQVQVAYLDPSIDFSKYKKILLMPLNFDKTKIVQPPKMNSRLPNNKWVLTDDDKKQFEKIYQDQMTGNLEKRGDFEITKTPGPDTLILDISILELRPNAPKDDFSRDFSSSRTTVFSQGSGAMSIGGGLYDGGTKKPVASFTDTRTRANLWGVNNRVTNTGDVSLAFAGWGQQLNKALKKLQAQGMVDR